MIDSKFSKIIFFFILILFSFLILLNYTVKNPNDGVLYLSSAYYFIENNILIDATRSMDGVIRPFPTTQFGITYFFILLISLFKSFWIFAYIILFSLIWVVLIKKLYLFSYKNFSQNKYLALILPFLIFFNYDYLISASSFYNETLYYPFLIFCFLKIINNIKKNKSFFQKSFLFVIFLALGSIFRVQHVVLLAALGIYFLIYKKFKEFFFISILSLINVLIIIKSYDLIQNFQISEESNILIDQSTFSNFILFIKGFFYDFYTEIKELQFHNTNIYFKNFKVHFAQYSNVLNIPKIFDITLPNYGGFYKGIKGLIFETIYIFITLFIIFCLYKYFKSTKINKIKIFLIFYFISNSIFIFFLTDVISRYFLYINFCMAFFLSDYLKSYKYVSRDKKYFFSAGLVYFIVITIYGFSYFKNYSLEYKSPTFKTLNKLKVFNKNRKGFFYEDEIFISRYNYQVKWIIDRASLNPDQFIAFHKNYKPDRKYFFIGSKNEFYNTKLASTELNVDYIENYLYIEVDGDEPSIWKIHLKSRN